ncbi:hypothetical protein BGZ82_002038 [Podila clonocystis]|nr:hypothetical protein BGZ82_002038 [Podila clonocystis]
MFDILELDEMLCLQLDRKALLQCAKVINQWNDAAIPFIWQTIPLWGWDKLREHVLEDYLQEQYLLEQQLSLEYQPPQPPAKKPQQSRSSKKQPPRLERWQKPDHLALTSQSNVPEYSIPSALDLARHFHKRCPNALFDFEMTLEFFTSDELFDFALTTILPKANALSISGDDGDDDESRIPIPFSKLQRALAAASSDHLYSLSLSIPKNQFVLESDAEGSTDITHEFNVTARPKCLKIYDID